MNNKQMKLISLNIWGGGAYEPLIKFIKDNAGDTDVFCFQEVFFSSAMIVESRGVRLNILADIAAALPGFHCLIAPIGSGYDTSGPIDIDVSEEERLQKNKTIDDIPCNFQYVCFRAENKAFTICNMHGVANPGDKKDNDERLEQSNKVINFLAGKKGAKILCGDFNLLPETKSIAMIEEAGMINLIKKFAIECTRSRLSPWFGSPDFQEFADYTFVSPDVNVLNFTVPDVEVSDHLPLVLEFS